MTEFEHATTNDAAAQATNLSDPGVASTLPPGARVTDDQIRLRAFELYRERGGMAGDDVSDWLRAERECREGR